MLSLRIAAVYGFLAVALGAFGAHGLQPLLLSRGTVETWHTASLYHLVHAAVLLALAARAPARPGLPFRLFCAGVLLFSGSLYLFALTQTHWLVFVTPFGGVTLLAGWLWLGLKGFE